MNNPVLKWNLKKQNMRVRTRFILLPNLDPITGSCEYLCNNETVGSVNGLEYLNRLSDY